MESTVVSCPVCLLNGDDEYEYLVKTFIKLSCNHVFCVDCLNNCVISNLLTCPLCRGNTFNFVNLVVNQEKKKQLFNNMILFNSLRILM